MYMPSNSPKRISPEEVKKDNSNLWRYSTDLYSALRKEKFSKPDTSSYVAYVDYKDALGELTPVSQYDSVDLRLDIDTFKKSLSGVDLDIFNLMLLGMTHVEISKVVGLSRAPVSKRLANIREQFKEFYCSGD